MVELAPCIDELLFVDEFWFDEMDEGEYGLEIHLLLSHWIAFV